MRTNRAGERADEIRAAIKKVLDAHTPHITNEIELELSELTSQASMREFWDGEGVEIADLALRECGCGKRIDGFYEYVDHLREVFGI